MGIYEGYREDNKENAIISLNMRDFKELGYFLRDFKKKFRGREVLGIKITLSIDYYKNRLT